MVRFLLWLLAGAGTVIALTGCYSAEDSWQICCDMSIVQDDEASPTARRTIMGWQRYSIVYNGDGSAVEQTDPEIRPASHTARRVTVKQRRIEAAMAEFMAGNPGAKASDYFKRLEMTCVRGSPKSDVTRCSIDLPIRFECISLPMLFPGGPRIPKELRHPMPGVLQMSVDVSGDAFVATASRIVPLPGGRLCQRQRSDAERGLPRTVAPLLGSAGT